MKKATTDLVARTRMDAVAPVFEGDLVIHVDVHDLQDQVVMTADIAMYISRAKQRTA